MSPFEIIALIIVSYIIVYTTLMPIACGYFAWAFNTSEGTHFTWIRDVAICTVMWPAYIFIVAHDELRRGR